MNSCSSDTSCDVNMLLAVQQYLHAASVASFQRSWPGLKILIEFPVPSVHWTRRSQTFCCIIDDIIIIIIALSRYIQCTTGRTT
jgi:hypothetical protein